jgi:alpha-glucosidase
LPLPPDAASRNAAALRDDPGSILHLYRRLLKLRRETPALHRGAIEPLAAAGNLPVYRRYTDDDERCIAINFDAAPAVWTHGSKWTIELSSDGVGEGRPFTGDIGGDRALILRPSASTPTR